MTEPMSPRKWAWIVFFTSSSTLICCALPILLVSLGLGAVSATLFAGFPFLVTLAQHKTWMFLGSAVVLALTGWLLYRPGRACPTDPDLAEQCGRAHPMESAFFLGGAAVWMVGVAAASLALPIYLWLGGE